MNKVFFRAEEIPMPSWTKDAERFIRMVLDEIKLRNWELSVLFCSNKYIQSLNAQYRGRDEPTDVLSFALGTHSPGGRFLAGDIVLSLDALAENVRYFRVSEKEELHRLLVHGILHLAGYDHATNKTKEPMLKTQEEIIARIAGKAAEDCR
jgi:probable rRNA maturation factor